LRSGGRLEPLGADSAAWQTTGHTGCSGPRILHPAGVRRPTVCQLSNLICSRSNLDLAEGSAGGRRLGGRAAAPASAAKA
jgi:hypothetical protein